MANTIANSSGAIWLLTARNRDPAVEALSWWTMRSAARRTAGPAHQSEPASAAC
jgi:hypothetical protein